MKRALVAVALLIVVLCVLFIIGQTNQVVSLASTLDPVLGRVVLWVLLSIYAICGLGPVILFLRLPRRLEAPSEKDDAAGQRHLAAVARRLARNRHLAGRLITADRDSIDDALALLHTKAKERIATAATMVFIGTALVRSGRLEGVMLLVTHTRMIWQIAHLHWQRPTLRDMIWLYSNVGATILAAQAVEDMDPTDILQPIFAPLVGGSALAVMPGVGPIAAFLTDGIVEGAFNAFLTLRVGCIANRYCEAIVRTERKLIRRSATVEAVGMLHGIVLNGVGAISKAVVQAAGESFREKASAIGRAIANAAEKAAEAIASAVKKGMSPGHGDHRVPDAT
jgi:uncharacterized protein DUF697